ncbi:hypothetical protein HKX48_005804 [Thoreauomyces humboldtii]|nr:hypothetical protein HKX48_005804 [Thoreauomyces humboldtii]
MHMHRAKRAKLAFVRYNEFPNGGSAQDNALEVIFNNQREQEKASPIITSRGPDPVLPDPPRSITLLDVHVAIEACTTPFENLARIAVWERKATEKVRKFIRPSWVPRHKR